MEEVGATIGVLIPTEANGLKDHDGSASIGPTVTAEVLVEGQTVIALLDTELSVTILSLKFIVNRWAKLKKESKTKGQWKDEVRRRLQAPSLVLKNYRGNELNILKDTLIKTDREWPLLHSSGATTEGSSS